MFSLIQINVILIPNYFITSCPDSHFLPHIVSIFNSLNNLSTVYVSWCNIFTFWWPARGLSFTINCMRFGCSQLLEWVCTLLHITDRISNWRIKVTSRYNRSYLIAFTHLLFKFLPNSYNFVMRTFSFTFWCQYYHAFWWPRLTVSTLPDSDTSNIFIVVVVQFIPVMVSLITFLY